MTYEECKGECEHCDCEWATIGAHDFDDDGGCTKCGFDGAEWHWWKHSTYEGRAQPEAKMPRCKVPNVEFSGQAAALSPRSSAGTQGYASSDDNGDTK